MFFLSLATIAGLAAQATATFDINQSPNAVGICYSVWHSLGYTGSPPPDITDIQHGHGSFAPQTAFHFWGRPAGGYYPGGDRSVIDRHFSQITDAGIDFIVIDATNLWSYGNFSKGLFTEPTDVLLEEMQAQRAAKKPTPYVVFWVGSWTSHEGKAIDPSAVGRFVHDRYYKNPDYSDFWVEFGGKPLMLTTDALPQELSDNFTIRKMWGLRPKLADGEWSYLEDAPQKIGKTGTVNEHVSISAAKQNGYMSDTAHSTSRKEGETYQSQWQRAFDVKPKLVTLTWWNEWMAQRQKPDGQGHPQFVDNYNSEFSRDIEPQDPSQVSGHGSKYLEWTKAYIAAYKANKPMPAGLTGY